MLMRNILIVVGGLGLFAGLALSVIWFVESGRAPTEAKAPETVNSPAILVAARPIASGTLLRSADVTWRDVAPTEIHPGALVRGLASETGFLGAVTRRAFGMGDPLLANELVKPSDREFLAAVLKPGTRAISISVDASQSASGLILPGDRVDVILTQNFGDATDPAHKLVGETVLVDVRTIAVDQLLNAAFKATPAERRSGTSESQVPKTVTLELSPRQAEVLLVAGELGRLGVSVRALEGSGAQAADSGRSSPPVWASDVSPALKELGGAQPRPYTSGSSVEKSLRRVPPPGASPFMPPVAEGTKQ